MIETASGIILRTRPLTETSLIIHWITPASGRLDTVAKGARRPKSPFHGKLDFAFACDFSFSRSARSSLHTLREVVLCNAREPLRHDLGWVRQAAYAASLIEQTTETDSPIPEIHALFDGLLNHLPRHPAKPRTVLAFELKLLRELGLEPDVTESRLAPKTRELVTVLLESDWKALQALQPTATEARELQQFLHGFLIYHLGKLPKGREAALA
jgi:DNA repair protein RecO (recombination protein O)